MDVVFYTVLGVVAVAVLAWALLQADPYREFRAEAQAHAERDMFLERDLPLGPPPPELDRLNETEPAPTTPQLLDAIRRDQHEAEVREFRKALGGEAS